MDSEQAEQLTLIIKCVGPKRMHAAIATMTEDGMLTVTGAEGDVLAEDVPKQALLAALARLKLESSA